MKNIMHFEDSAFFLPAEEIIELAAAAILAIGAKASIGDVNIKWDGTCLVFGNRDGFFLSDKGFYNKTPRMFRSTDEIYEANMSPEKKSKLMHAFSTLENIKIRPEMVYTADWLFDFTSISEDGKSFQPNLIKYKYKYDLGHYRLGLSVHTQAFCGVESISYWSPFHQDIFFTDDGFSRFFGTELSGYVKLFGLLTGITKGWQLEQSQIKELRKLLNEDVRTYDYYDRRNLHIFSRKGYDFLAFNLDILIRIKYILLMRLNQIAKEYSSYEMSIGGEPATHEGFVFRFKDHRVKLVDRYKFSKKNFDQSIKRGWASDGIRAAISSRV